MNYGYRINNVSPTQAFVKRVVLYLCILMMTVALALIVLFILFERYLSLIAPALMISASVLILILMGRKVGSYFYSFGERRLIVSDRVKTYDFDLDKMIIVRNAEKSDFFDKSIIKLSFIDNKIVLKNNLNENNLSISSQLVSYCGKHYILALDNYSRALMGGAESED